MHTSLHLWQVAHEFLDISVAETNLNQKQNRCILLTAGMHFNSYDVKRSLSYTDENK